MNKNTLIGAAVTLVLSFTATPAIAMEQLTVMISGGFSLAYGEISPGFERDTGVKITTLSGASQGTGPKTIKSQLESGADVDVVILSREGLEELKAAGRIAGGSEGELAIVPLAAAIRQGSPKPDISTVDGFKQALLNAKLVVMPGSTSGIFLRDAVLPKLGIAAQVSSQFVPRGAEGTRMVAAGETDLAIGPLSELIEQPGIELIGTLPTEIQFMQVFTAAIVSTSHHPVEAKQLIEFLASEHTAAAIKRSGMIPVGLKP